MDLSAPSTAGFDLDGFRKTGVQVLRNFFEPDIRERFAALGRKIGQEARDGVVTRSAQFVGGTEVDPGEEVALSAKMRAVAIEALGENACWLITRVLMKDKTFNDSIEAHQDWPYFAGDTRKMNVFVPLTPCNRANGMMVFYEGSHSFGPVERGTIDVDRYPQFTPICPDLEVGDVLLADFLTWHSSVPASNDDDRILLQVVLQPASDRSSNMVFGAGWQDLGPTNTLRTSPMLNARPSVGPGLAYTLLNTGFAQDARRMGLGLLMDSQNNVEAHLLLHAVAAKLGENGELHLAAAEGALEALRVQLADLRGEPAQAAPSCGPLAAEPSVDLQAEVDRLTQELKAVRASTSWRLTAPLRRLRGQRQAR